MEKELKDFYFSQTSDELRRQDGLSEVFVVINGEKIKYTEMITSGQTPMTKFADLVFLGSATIEDVDINLSDEFEKAIKNLNNLSHLELIEFINGEIKQIMRQTGNDEIQAQA
jgi:hypothetical protein